MINKECCTLPSLCQDIYNCILSHVSCLHVIRNVSMSNIMLNKAIKYVKYIDDSVLLKFLVNEKEDIIFPYLQKVRGDIIVHPRLYGDTSIVQRLLKLTNIKKIRIKCNYSENEIRCIENLTCYLLTNDKCLVTVCHSLVNYSSISHLFEHFQLSCEDDMRSFEIYKLTRKDKLIRLEFIESEFCLYSNKIFIPIQGYEYIVYVPYSFSIH